jgi:collagenase-like PrtC family protease
MKLSVGPILNLWDRATMLAFYESLCSAPVDIVYLGEVVCSKRRLLHNEDWPRVIEMLRDAGKEVVISTLPLAEAESELATIARLVEDAGGLVEANDYACVECVSGRPFVAGPHLNVCNDATLRVLARKGARRWVAPVELPLAIVAALAELRPANMEVEMLAYGRLPLRTQSAAVHNLLPHIHTLRNAGVDVLRLSPDLLWQQLQTHRNPNVFIASIDQNQRGGIARGF